MGENNTAYVYELEESGENSRPAGVAACACESEAYGAAVRRSEVNEATQE